MSKISKIALHLDVLFWFIIVVSTTVFDMIFSPTFWVFVAICGLIEACARLLKSD